MNDEIQRLHTHDEFKDAEVRARIDELKRIEIHVESGVWTFGNDPQMAMLISERLAELEAQLKEKV